MADDVVLVADAVVAAGVLLVSVEGEEAGVVAVGVGVEGFSALRLSFL
ncbi:MAG TPA: hypothetical protein VNT80_05390 [Acidimicrobiales bacterium]|jgi:hypothetical protein|nr:hypothetical protein [Acidimicrobiales bacterium]